jgi:hypothetical protein
MSESTAIPAALVIGLQALLVAVMLHACWDAPFYDVDDKHHVRMATGAPLIEAFTPKVGLPYIPVTLLSYNLDSALFGPDEGAPRAEALPSEKAASAKNWAPGIRVLNGFYHFIAGVLLWLFLRRMQVGLGTAAVISLIWTGHPMACESVCWIAERKNVLAAMFGFAALLAWTEPPARLWRWPLVWIFYWLALLSKPAALGLLPIIVALEIIDPLRAEFSWRVPRHWLRLAALMIIPILISAHSIYATVSGHTDDIVDPPGGSVWTALLTDTEIFSRYIYHVLLPHNLSFYYYVEPIVSLLDLRLWLYGGVLIVFTAGLIWLAEPSRRRLSVLGIIWFLGALGPNSNIVATAFPMQDRFVYLAAPGLLLSVILALQGLLSKMPDGQLWMRRSAIAFLVVLTLLLSTRSPVYSSSDRLELDAAERQPLSGRARSVAAQICASAYRRHSRNGPQPDEQLATLYAKKALLHFQGAFDAPDIDFFVERLRIRVSHANFLVMLGDRAEARKVLDGWIPPPPTMQMLDSTDENGQKLIRKRSVAQKGYAPETLAHGWRLSAEIRLPESQNPALPTAAAIEIARKALSESEESLKIHVCDYEAAILRGRILFRLSDLFAAQQDFKSARQHFDESISSLKQIPENCGSSRAAKKMISVAKAPSGGLE